MKSVALALAFSGMMSSVVLAQQTTTAPNASASTPSTTPSIAAPNLGPVSFVTRSIGDTRLKLPIPDKFCEIETSRAAHQRVASAVDEALASGRNTDNERITLVRAVECDMMESVRAGAPRDNFVVLEILALKETGGAPITAAQRQSYSTDVCTSMMSASAQELGSTMPRNMDQSVWRINELTRLADRNKAGAFGVIQQTELACYVGGVIRVTPTGRSPRDTGLVVSTMLVGNHTLTIDYRSSDPGRLTELFHRARSIVGTVNHENPQNR